MDQSFRSGLILLGGIALLATAGAIHAILLEATLWNALIAAAGLGLSAWGTYALRSDLGAMIRHRRGEIALYTLGVVGILSALAYLSVLFPMRLDMTKEGRYSLSTQTVGMLKALGRPVNITFFHDPMMRETVELYQLMARQTDKVTLELYDPMLNPAQARLRGVQFAGTALMESEGRKLQISSDKETDIANGILRVSMGVQETLCFLDGHREPDPFSQETHDHIEGAPGHSHGLGVQYVLHQQHGMAKARNALEAMNYKVEKVLLARNAGGDPLSHCSLLVVAGPQLALLPPEVAAIRTFLAAGGNALFMLDPFVRTDLEPVLREYGIVVDDDIVIDEASHFWADPSSPAVTDYNYHRITSDLPLTFFPGARSLSPTPQRFSGVNVIPLVNSSKSSWGQYNATRVEFKEGRDVRGPTTLMAVALRRPVAGDAPVYRSAQKGNREDRAPNAS
ncbi:MAG: Gldg family protein, partial [Burkholderiales bacterium]